MRRKHLAAVALVALAQLTPMTWMPEWSTSAVTDVHAEVEAVASITLVGHGNGHGIGLSQWGAYGDAVDKGWSAWQIVDHYFGGTVHGTSDRNAVVTVDLQALDGAQTAVVSDAELTGVPGVSGMHAMVARKVAGAGYSVWASAAPACPAASDPLAAWGPPLATGLPSVTFATAAPVDTAAYGQLVSVCQPAGTALNTYRGTISAVTGPAGEIRTVNAVPVEQYMRSVVAKEMSPSWAGAGGGRGMAALQAQVIAGRSYALSEHLFPYAMTCDSVCQTYQGAASRAAVGGAYTAVEHPLSDPAVSSTAGMVLRTTAGGFAHAMYSASSGGYTAPSAVLGFPAVPDDGDATPGNPYHNWTATLSTVAIHTAYPTIGTFTGITVTARNGDGDLGGRVLSMTVAGTDGSVTVTGDQFRSALGLKSNWFALAGAPQTRANTIRTGATALAPATRLKG